MHKRLIDMYSDLKESGSISDFPNILGNVMYKQLQKSFEAVSTTWRQVVSISRLADFKPHDRTMLHGFGGLDKIVKNGVRVGDYKDRAIQDSKYQIQLDTDGAAFSIGRETIINDDQNALSQVPSMLGLASARHLNEGITGLLAADSLSADGDRLFSVDHANYSNIALANTAAGKAAVIAAINKIEKSTDIKTGKRIGLKAKYLVTGIDLQFAAIELLKAMNFIPVTTTGGGTANGLEGRLIPIVLPDLPASAWYVMAEPSLFPAIEVGFLNGKQTPDLLVRKPEMVNLAGGDDMFGYEFDDLLYKVRYDFALKVAYHQGIFRGKA